MAAFSHPTSGSSLYAPSGRHVACASTDVSALYLEVFTMKSAIQGTMGAFAEQGPAVGVKRQRALALDSDVDLDRVFGAVTGGYECISVVPVLRVLLHTFLGSGLDIESFIDFIVGFIIRV